MYKRWIGLFVMLTVLLCGCSEKAEDGGNALDSETETMPGDGALEDTDEGISGSGDADGTRENGTADMTGDMPEAGTEDMQEESIPESGAENNPAKTVPDNSAGDTPEDMAREGDGIFARLPFQFYCGSSAGAWGETIDLMVNSNGSFLGHYTDAESLDSDEDGYSMIVRQSDFSGWFAQPVQLDAHIYATSVERLMLEWDGEDEIINDILYHYVEPCGLSESAEILIYTPGTPIEDVAEEIVRISSLDQERREVLPEGCYGIYNATDGYGFWAIHNDCLWNYEYTGSTGKAEVRLRPSVWSSHLSINTELSGMYFWFDWDEDDQTDFWVHEDSITAGYQMHLDFNEDRSKVTLTLTSDLGISLVKYGGTKEGVLTVELKRTKQ